MVHVADDADVDFRLPGTFIALLLPRVFDRLRPALNDLQVQLQDVGEPCSLEPPSSSASRPDGMEADSAAHQEAFPPRPGQVAPHRKPSLSLPP